MANNNNIPKKSYEQLKDELKRKVEEKRTYDTNYFNEIKLLIRDMVAVLRTVEKKERAAVSQQIKNDFLDLLGKSTIYKILKEIYEEGLEIKKEEKQKIAIAADGSQILDEGGAGGDDSKNDIYSSREKAKQDRETRTIKKGSSQMQKIKPSVVGDIPGEEEEEETEQEQGTYTDENEDILTLKESNNVIIEHEDHLREILALLKQNKAVVVLVNQYLEPIGISAGKDLPSKNLSE